MYFLNEENTGGPGTSGFVQFQHRWYDPETGKWLSRDPIGVMGGVNLYGYAGNNGVNRIDVDGLKSKGKTCDEKYSECTIKAALGVGSDLVQAGIGMARDAAVCGGIAATYCAISTLAYGPCVTSGFVLCMSSKGWIVNSAVGAVMTTISWGIDIYTCNVELKNCRINERIRSQVEGKL